MQILSAHSPFEKRIHVSFYLSFDSFLISSACTHHLQCTIVSDELFNLIRLTS
jgi:hypothetical protein